MKIIISTILISLSIVTCQGQSIIGQWTTYDDNTKEKKAIIEIYQNNDIYLAKIVESFSSDKNAICEICKGAKKDQPIICLLYTSPSPRDQRGSRMPSSA